MERLLYFFLFTGITLLTGYNLLLHCSSLLLFTHIDHIHPLSQDNSLRLSLLPSNSLGSLILEAESRNFASLDRAGHHDSLVLDDFGELLG